MQLKIEKGTFKDYSLEDISNALRKGLSENFQKVEGCFVQFWRFCGLFLQNIVQLDLL